MNSLLFIIIAAVYINCHISFISISRFKNIAYIIYYSYIHISTAIYVAINSMLIFIVVFCMGGSKTKQ